MAPSLPPLNGLRLFESSARLLSFKRAAEELHLTPSAVSHGIQSLEQWLDVMLFVRTPKGLTLTPEGAHYYKKVQAGLALLAEGTAQISPRLNRILRITAAPTFATRMLLPWLSEFRQAHPDIAVAVDTSRECIDLDGMQADVAIRVGDGSWPGLAADELLRERLIPVCAPHRLAEFAGRELCELPLIHVVTVSEDWQYWAETTGRKLSPLQIGLRFDTLQMAFDAAAQGLGVAIGRRPLIDTEIRAGRLTPLFEEEAICKSAHWLLSRHTRDDAVQTFRSWMKSRTASAMSN